MSVPPSASGGYEPKSKAGRLVLHVFIATIFVTLIMVFIVKHDCPQLCITLWIRTRVF